MSRISVLKAIPLEILFCICFILLCFIGLYCFLYLSFAKECGQKAWFSTYTYTYSAVVCFHFLQWNYPWFILVNVREKRIRQQCFIYCSQRQWLDVDEMKMLHCWMVCESLQNIIHNLPLQVKLYWYITINQPTIVHSVLLRYVVIIG